MRKFSKKFIVRGAQFCAPILLLLMIIAVTSLARARPVEAAKKTSDFQAFCWDDREELVKHLKNGQDSNQIRYSEYGFKVDTRSSMMYLKGRNKPIDLTARCHGSKSPYRWWFWVKGNKLRTSPIHWSTDSFIATTKPLTYKNGNYNTNQYTNQGDHAPVKCYEVSKTDGFIKSKGKPVFAKGAKWGISFYVIDLSKWYNNKNYNKLADDYSGRVFIHTIASIYGANERRLAGPFTTLASWQAAARARGFDSRGVDDYKDHYNQIIPINNHIKHELRIYRMHTSKKNPVAGKITDKGEVDESCKFTINGKDSSFIAKKPLKAGSVFTLSNIKTYEYGGTKYYLKGIREVHIDENGKAQPYAKFMMLDSLNDNPVAGTDKLTDKYTKVKNNDVSKVDSISSKTLMYYKECHIKVNNHSVSVTKKSKDTKVKHVAAGKKKGLTGKKKWSALAEYMKNLHWKNGIKENRIYLVYQEIPEISIKVFNKVYEHVDGKGYVCVSGATSPVYKEKIQSGDDKIAVNLTKIQERSIAKEKPDKAGCAAVYKTLGSKKYFPKDIKISYTDTNGNDTTKKFSIKDYYYDSANESVGEAGDGFVETDTKKTYSINTGHRDTEKALSAIVKYVYEKVKLNADRSGEVKIEINYYQPKVPNVALIYRRSYDESGKAVDTLVQTKKLGNTVL